jgi:hypothetical protein
MRLPSKAQVVSALMFIVGLVNVILPAVESIDTTTEIGLVTGSAGVVAAALTYLLGPHVPDALDAYRERTRALAKRA